MSADEAPDDSQRMTYEPTGGNRRHFRPTSAPRAAQDRRDRPTSAPLAREGGGSGGSSGGSGYGGGDGGGGGREGEFVHDAGALADAAHGQAVDDGMSAGGYYPYSQRPASASSRPPYVLESLGLEMPWSVGAGGRAAARRTAGTRLPGGGLRFVEEASVAPPMRVFSPMTSPQTDKTRFQAHSLKSEKYCTVSCHSTCARALTLRTVLVPAHVGPV